MLQSFGIVVEAAYEHVSVRSLFENEKYKIRTIILMAHVGFNPFER